MNGKIWDLESDIRKGKEGELGLEEVGRRAIAVRELNKIRVGYKNDIVDMFKEGIIDPTRVTKSALQNAASIAGLMLTTEVMITKIDEESSTGKVSGAVR